MPTLSVGTAQAEPGSVGRGAIAVTNHPGGGALGIPVVVVNGAQPGKVLWVDACIHGDEPEGTLAVHKLVASLDPRAMHGALVAVPAMNVGAFEAAERGNPADTFSYDMNRIYPGKPDGYLTERVAWAHSQAMVAVADLELSIHSGGGHSYLSETIFATEDAPSIELAKAMGRGWGLILKSFLPKGNPMAVMLEHGKTGITVELGGRCATLPEAFHRSAEVLAEACRNVMRYYGIVPGEPTSERSWHTGKQRALLASHSGLWVPEPSIRFQAPLRKGEVLARIYDLHGAELEVLCAPCDGLVFGLRSLPTVRTGDWACFYGEISGTLE
jgi:predicted deacylase